MFCPEASTYTNPVVSSEALLNCLSDRYHSDSLITAPELRLMTVKTCNAPDLLQRSLNSFMPSKPEYMEVIVVDDSKNDLSRVQNEEIAADSGVTYLPVLGHRAIMPYFEDFIA